MALHMKLLHLMLIVVAAVSGGIAVAFVCIAIATSNWQVTQAIVTNDRIYTNSTANFFYTCVLNSTGDAISCDLRRRNLDLQQYYLIVTTGNQSNWYYHLDAATGLSILGIVFIFFGTQATILMLTCQRVPWIPLTAPSMLIVSCLFLLAGLAEGARVLLYNVSSASLYETAHLLTIFSFLISALVGGLLFDSPRVPSMFERIKNDDK